MAPKLEVGKVILGAFLVPWWNRRAFARGLAIPLVSLVTLTLCWYYGANYLPEYSNWALLFVYGFLFVLFAVTCHRLVLLDPISIASLLPARWSWRESRFFFWLCFISWLATVVAMVATTVIMAVFFSFAANPPDQAASEWAFFAATFPAFYLFARLCLVFPATAVDRKVNLKWAWRMTKGNGWRLFLVVAVLPWILSQMIGLLYRGDATVGETILLTFVSCALFAVEIAALSLSYRELTRDEAARLS
jgi:hypothetical protein